MKRKLWIMWGCLGATAILEGILGAKELAYGFAITAAIAGWSAFLMPKRR